MAYKFGFEFCKPFISSDWATIFGLNVGPLSCLMYVGRIVDQFHSIIIFIGIHFLGHKSVLNLRSLIMINFMLIRFLTNCNNNDDQYTIISCGTRFFFTID